MKKLIFASLFLILSLACADAQSQRNPCYTTNGTNCIPVSPTTPLPVTPSAPSGTQSIDIEQVLGAPVSATNPLFVAPSTSANFKVNVDQTTPGTTNLVSAGLAQQIANTPTVTANQYVSGNCIGGFNAVTVSINNGQSGFLTNFRFINLTGNISNSNITVYLFDSNPSASTCTDKGSFSLNNADVDKLIATPQTITPAVSTGSSATFAGIDFLPPRPFIAGGSTASGVKTIYYGMVSGSTFGLSSTTGIHVRLGAALN